MNAAHLLNRRSGSGLKGLSRLDGAIHRSCCWLIRDDDATALVGGWICLHTSKSARSIMGGLVRRIERAVRIDAAIPEGVALIFESREEGRGVAWHGADHGMAWWSGLVAADTPPEIG